MAYALITVALALLAAADLLVRGPVRAPPAWAPAAHVALVGGLVVCATFTAAVYAWKLAGGEPEHLLEADSPVAGALAGALLAPYSLVALVLVHAEHRLSGEAFADEVYPGLWVGRAPMPWEGSRVGDLGVGAVLNLCAEFGDLARLERASFCYARVPVLDATGPSLARLARAATWCRERLGEGQPVLVHCAHGHGRSALVVAATLLDLGRCAGPAEALATLAEARPGVKLSPRQRALLAAYHRSRK